MGDPSGENALLRISRQLGYYTTRLSDRWMDWRLGISTDGSVVDISGTHPGVDCTPISYRSFGATVKRLHLNAGVDVFVDYGAGRGRAVVMAAMHPFRRVIGVELLEPLVSKASENLARVARKLRCPDVQILHCDAVRYQLPDDATIIHFYNPFYGEVLGQVMDEIERSLCAAPRALTILFANPDHFESLLRARPWQLTREDVVWPGCPDPSPDSNRYRIYRVTSVAS